MAVEQRGIKPAKQNHQQKESKRNGIPWNWNGNRLLTTQSQTDTAQNGQKSMLNIINLIRRSAKYLPDYIAFLKKLVSSKLLI